MAKTKMNFRLSDDALMALARLSGLWGCDRTAVIERALAEADPVSVPPTAPPRDEPQITMTEHSITVPVFSEPKSEAPMDSPKKDTRTRQEKADDFYRANMAKGKK